MKSNSKGLEGVVNTVTVPFMATITIDGVPLPPSPKDHKAEIEYEGRAYELHSVEGTKWVWFEDEQDWVDLGWNAHYQLKDKSNEQD